MIMKIKIHFRQWVKENYLFLMNLSGILPYSLMLSEQLQHYNYEDNEGKKREINIKFNCCCSDDRHV